MDLVIDNAKLHLGSKKATFMVQIEKDATFLAELNIMDYSLLVRFEFMNMYICCQIQRDNNMSNDANVVHQCSPSVE